MTVNIHNHDPIHPSEHGEEFTRPLSVLLAIARKYLITKEQPEEVWNERDCYTCIAAATAFKKKEITDKEYWALKSAIHEALNHYGYFYSTIYSMMLDYDDYVKYNIHGATEPAFFPLRDKWLDTLGKKFEMTEAMDSYPPVHNPNESEGA